MNEQFIWEREYCVLYRPNMSYDSETDEVHLARVQLSTPCTQARPCPELLLHSVCKNGFGGAAELWKAWCKPLLLRLTIPIYTFVAFLRAPQVEAVLSAKRKWELHTLPALTACCTWKYVNLVWLTQATSSCGGLIQLSQVVGCAEPNV